MVDDKDYVFGGLGNSKAIFEKHLYLITYFKKKNVSK